MILYAIVLVWQHQTDEEQIGGFPESQMEA